MAFNWIIFKGKGAVSKPRKSKKAPGQLPGALFQKTARSNYGRRLAFAFAFAFIFELGRFAFAFIFEFILAAGVAGGAMVGAGVAVLILVRFALLLLALFDVASPQPMPRAPIAKTVASAILFIFLNSSPVFSKVL